MHTSFSHGASLSLKRPMHHRMNSGVSAAVWEWLGPMHTSFSQGASLSLKRPRQDRRNSAVSTDVWGWLDLVYPPSPTGRPYSPSGPSTTEGTQVYPPLCGNCGTLCIVVLPRGVPIPQAAQARPEGLGFIRGCVGVGGPMRTTFSHGASLSPKRARQDRRD